MDLIQNLFPTLCVSPGPRVTSLITLQIPRCFTSSLCSNDWTLHGPSQPLGMSGLLYILYIMGFLYMGLFIQARFRFVTWTVGAVARFLYGLSKFSLRRTFEPGVEMMISPGRFDIITRPDDRD
uniref:AL5 n=1 Tax=Begomovirus manihotis TaxID=10817 RepID=A0A0S2CWQ5_9GEMI|nr:hypothetical protein [African cassava mosaic virus]ALN49349.1 hypothetical protein [African cassava mosaic virus]